MLDSSPAVDDAFGHWFAGFVDGEGCFQIEPHGGNAAHRGYHCYFSLSVRADDESIIREIWQTLGIGKVYDCKRKNPSPAENPAIRWAVMAKGQCLQLARVFDRYPLRSKKAQDYRIWRAAVIEWHKFAQGGNHRRDWSYMAVLYGELRKCRGYGGKLAVLPADAPSLWEEGEGEGAVECAVAAGPPQERVRLKSLD